jgi:hypothetical protein
MRPASNASSGEPGEVPDDDVNAHLGNPDEEIDRIASSVFVWRNSTG